MAIVDRTGATPFDIATYRGILEDRFRQRFGQDLALDEETPQAQIIGIMALSLAEEDESIIFDANGHSISRGQGYQLYDHGELLGIQPLRAARSTVTAQLTGSAGTVIPFRSRARTSAGAEFRTLGEVTLTGADDTVQMESVEIGPIAAPAGSLTNIVTAVAGWTGITNQNAAALGRLAETDIEFRTRYTLLTTRLAAGFPAAIRARILEVPGVIRAQVHNNPSGGDVVEQGLTIPERGILAIVQGGADQAVADAIEAALTGAATGGSVTVGDIQFERVVETPVKVAINTLIEPHFPSDGINLIINAILAYAVDHWTIGDPIDIRALTSPAYSVIGHRLNQEITAVNAGDDSALPATPNLNVLYTLDRENVQITTTS